MDTIKIAALTGLFAATGSAAVAADLTRAYLPSSPLIRDSRESSLGWYLRGDLGYADYKRPDADFAARPFTTSFTRENLGHAATLGAGLGYRFNSNVRVDLTLDHTFDARFKGVAPAPALATASIMDKGSFHTSRLMANGYLDFRPVMGFTPYIGAGLGMAHNVLSDHVLTTYDTATGVETAERFTGGDGFSFAWALMAGVGYRLSSGFTLDLGYRYVGLGDVKTRSYGDGTGVAVDSIGAHEMKVGLRYSLR